MQRSLTAKQVQHVKSDPERRLEVSAGPPAGLYLVVQPSGAKSWALRYRWHGTTRNLTLGLYPALSLAGARADAEAKLEELNQGLDPAVVRAQEVKEQRLPDSVPAVAEEWLARHVRPNARSWREIERILNREVLPSLKHKLITQVGRPDILRLLDAIVDRGAPVMANRTRAYLKSWLGWAEGRGYISASPMGSIKRATVERSRERVLADEELAIVWTATPGLGYPCGPFVRFLMLSAQRRGEVAGMRWEDVNFERGIWTLPAHATKPGRVHDVPLSLAMLAILRELPRFEGPYVFTTTSGKKAINGFSKLKARLGTMILENEKTLSDWSLHDLRRSAATWMAGTGVPPQVLSALLNHSPGKVQGITSVYNRFRYTEDRKEALERWGQHLMRLAAKTKAARKTG